MPTFRNIYLDILYKAAERQCVDGAMPAGHNGHYQDQETPVRNTSHYLIAFLRAWELSGDKRFKTAAEHCLNWLIKDNPHRQVYTFQHRTKDGKDHCNGLIGPAWNMEALLYAADKLQREDARRLARELFLMHPFDYTVGAWKRIEPDGTILEIDSTFNHQLWFAASAAPLAKIVPEANQRIQEFLSSTDTHWGLNTNGRIIHPLWFRNRRLREKLKYVLKSSYRDEVISKEIGYQAFNLQAFAMLILSGIVLPGSVRLKLKRALNYLRYPEYLNGIDSTKCGFPYNPPGWEVSVAKTVIGKDSVESCKSWLERQLLHSYDSDSCLLNRNTSDPETHTARIYEVAYMPNQLFQLDLNLKN